MRRANWWKVVTITYRVTPRAYLLLAIEALLFAREQPAISAETGRKINLALSSARRDLARLKQKPKQRPQRRSA